MKTPAPFSALASYFRTTHRRLYFMPAQIVTQTCVIFRSILMMATALVERAQSLEDQIIRWRRDLHMHPELGFQEFRTAGVVASALRDMGLEVMTGVGKTGVVAVLGEGKPVIGIRADMDA